MIVENKNVKAVIAVITALLLSACSTPAEKAYDYDPFFAGTPKIPTHPGKSDSERFFNKECKKVGNDSYAGNQYECWFSN